MLRNNNIAGSSDLNTLFSLYKNELPFTSSSIATPNAYQQNSSSNNTSISNSNRSDKLNKLAYLLEQRVDVNAKNVWAHTALFYSTTEQEILLLLRFGADVNDCSSTSLIRKFLLNGNLEGSVSVLLFVIFFLFSTL